MLVIICFFFELYVLDCVVVNCEYCLFNSLYKSWAMKIFIVDDDNISLDLMGLYIKGFAKNCELSLFYSPLGALKFLKSSSATYPDILITNLQMPGINGFEFIEQINDVFLDRDASAPPFRIILHTSYLGPESICLSAGRIAETPCFLRRLLAPGSKKNCKELNIEACVPKPLCYYKMAYLCEGKLFATNKMVKPGEKQVR